MAETTSAGPSVGAPIDAQARVRLFAERTSPALVAFAFGWKIGEAVLDARAPHRAVLGAVGEGDRFARVPPEVDGLPALVLAHRGEGDLRVALSRVLTVCLEPRHLLPLDALRSFCREHGPLLLLGPAFKLKTSRPDEPRLIAVELTIGLRLSPLAEKSCRLPVTLTRLWIEVSPERQIVCGSLASW